MGDFATAWFLISLANGVTRITASGATINT